MSDEQLLEKIARLEQELHQARTQEKTVSDLLEKKLDEIYIHYHVSRTISSLIDLHDMLDQIMKTAGRMISFDRVSVYLVDDSGDHLDLVYANGFEVPEAVQLERGEGMPGTIMLNGEHVHLHDLKEFYERGRFIHVPGEMKRSGSYIGVALKAHNTMIGVMGLDSPITFGLTVDDLDFMAILSHQIAAGIEKSRLFEKIQHLSQLDGLTSLYNHRLFQERLGQELTRRKRTRKPLALIMFDIDHFKKFNDSFGHQAGDGILEQLAGVIASHCRCSSIDICCRYGGEEFAIITPELETPVAATVAERIRSAVEKNAFRVNNESLAGRVTISMGVAGVAGPDDISPEELVQRADEALYRSKKTGRNRVTVAW